MDPDPGTLRGGAVNPRAPRPSARVPTHGRVARPAAVLRKQRRRVHTRSAAAQAPEPIKIEKDGKVAMRTFVETPKNEHYRKMRFRRYLAGQGHKAWKVETMQVVSWSPAS